MAGLAGFKPGEAGRATAHYCNTLHTHSLPPPPVFIWLPVSSQLGQLSSAGVAVRPLLQNITYYYPGKTTTLLSTALHWSEDHWLECLTQCSSLTLSSVSVQSEVWCVICCVTSYFILCPLASPVFSLWWLVSSGQLKATILLTISQPLCWSEVTTKQVGIQPPDPSLDAHEIDIW